MTGLGGSNPPLSAKVARAVPDTLVAAYPQAIGVTLDPARSAGKTQHMLTSSFPIQNDELEDHMSAGAAGQTMDAIIDLGRYAEVFAYDVRTHVISL